VLRRTGKF